MFDFNIWPKPMHVWEPKLYNFFGQAVGKKCRVCGEYTHRLSESGRFTEWKEGKHPNRPQPMANTEYI